VTRISSSDQVLILLREQLQRLGRGKADGARRSGRAAEASGPALARLKALAGRGAAGEDELRRALVRAVLTEELGEALANEPALQSVFDEVARIIGASAEGSEMLDRAMAQLRAAP
jgi:hypothetical protein